MPKLPDRSGGTRAVGGGMSGVRLSHIGSMSALYRLCIGIADSMSIARVRACWYSK